MLNDFNFFLLLLVPVYDREGIFYFQFPSLPQAAKRVGKRSDAGGWVDGARCQTPPSTLPLGYCVPMPF